MSGVDINGRQIRKGAPDAVTKFVGGHLPQSVEDAVTRISTIRRNSSGGS